jgi:hypothetical protein
LPANGKPQEIQEHRHIKDTSQENEIASSALGKNYFASYVINFNSSRDTESALQQLEQPMKITNRIEASSKRIITIWKVVVGFFQTKHFY